jgi:branched-chain amino acid aminotransferase
MFLFELTSKVKERKISVKELLQANEVFCTGTAVGISDVGSVTYKNKW